MGHARPAPRPPSRVTCLPARRGPQSSFVLAAGSEYSLRVWGSPGRPAVTAMEARDAWERECTLPSPPGPWAGRGGGGLQETPGLMLLMTLGTLGAVCGEEATCNKSLAISPPTGRASRATWHH